MAQQETGTARGWVWLGIVVAVLLAAIWFWRSERAAVPIKIANVERRDLIGTVATNGNVEPIEDFQAHAPAPGVVQRIFVSLGDHVKAGQDLVKMDDSEARRSLAQAEANLVSAELSLKNMKSGGTQAEITSGNSDMQAAQAQEQQAETSLHSFQQLQKGGAASANEVAAAQQRVKDAQMKMSALKAQSGARYGSGDVSAQQAQVVQAQAAVEAAKTALTNVDQHAPFAGTVYAIPVAEYDYVQGGEELLDVADLTKLQVRAYFDEPDVGKLVAGQAVTIKWDAKPMQVWHGHIMQVPTTIITYTTRHVGEALISVDDAKGDLLPNTNVTVTVTTLQKFNVLSLPREALHAEGDKTFVYKVVNNRLVQTPVQIGTANLTRFEITSGLQAGDVVALGATAADVDLSNGLKVKVPQ